MSDRKVSTVFFDLGETLINFGKVNVPALLRESAGLCHSYLREKGQMGESTGGYFRRSLAVLYWQLLKSRLTGRDFDSLKVLQRTGEKRGIQLSDEQWCEVNNLWYEPLRRRSQIEPGALECLSKLRDMGLKLGILSNTMVNACSLEKQLAEEGLLDFFPVRLYSYQFNFRKPDRRIFLEGARAIGDEPAKIVYVGDRIDKDVKGSLSAGMRPILKKAYTNFNKRPPGGTVVIEKIAELPDVIACFNDGT